MCICLTTSWCLAGSFWNWTTITLCAILLVPHYFNILLYRLYSWSNLEPLVLFYTLKVRLYRHHIWSPFTLPTFAFITFSAKKHYKYHDEFREHTRTVNFYQYCCSHLRTSLYCAHVELWDRSEEERDRRTKKQRTEMEKKWDHFFCSLFHLHYLHSRVILST